MTNCAPPLMLMSAVIFFLTLANIWLVARPNPAPVAGPTWAQVDTLKSLHKQETAANERTIKAYVEMIGLLSQRCGIANPLEGTKETEK